MTNRDETSQPPGTAGRIARTILPFAAGLLLAAILFRSVVFQGARTFFANWDASVQTYAWNCAVQKAAGDGAIKLWDFSTSSGTSFAGELQTAPFYPVGWLFGLLSPKASVQAMEWRLLAHFALAFGLAYHLFRHNTRRWQAAASGATVFAFVGSVALRAAGQPNIFEGLAYLPGVVLCAQKAFEGAAWRDNLRWSLFSGALMALMIAAGHMQPAIHAGLVLAGLAVWRAAKGDDGLRKAPLVLCLIAITAAVAVLPQLIALAEYLSESYRWIGASAPTRPPHAIPYEVYGFAHVLAGADLLGIFDRTISPKDACTLFVGHVPLLLAALAFFHRKKGLCLLFALLALGSVLVSMGDGSALGRLSYRVPVLNAVREPVRILCIYHLAVSFLVALGTAFLLEKIRWRVAGQLAGIAALGLCLAEAFAYADLLAQPRGTPYDPRSYYADKGLDSVLENTLGDGRSPSRYYAEPNDLLPPNLGNVLPMLSLRGHRATMQISYFDYLCADWNPESESFRRLGMRYLVTQKPRPGLETVAKAGDIYVQERTDYLGVFYLLQQGLPKRLDLEKVSWGENSVRLSLPAGHAGGVLVFAQPHYPGWRARVDGESRKLEKEGIFEAVRLAPSDKVVEFSYRPAWLWPSVAAALAVWTLILWQLARGEKPDREGETA